MRVMSFNVLPFGSRRIAESKPRAASDPAAQDAQSAEVVDLASRRETAMSVPEIPDQVWDEVDAASKLWHELRADDREVRFDTDAVTGRVVASLRDLGGGVVRALPLRQIPGLDDPGPASAA
jgi:hypothetical protein